MARAPSFWRRVAVGSPAAIRNLGNGREHFGRDRRERLGDGRQQGGSFQGAFPRNTLTFNPGWTAQNQPLPEFQDVREIQRQLKAQGVKLDTEVDEKTKGPASIMLTDPDGNPILFD